VLPRLYVAMGVSHAVIPSAPSKVTSFPRKRESRLLRGTPACAGVTKVRLSFLWVGYKPMAARNDTVCAGST
jgi:hypothetical protein